MCDISVFNIKIVLKEIFENEYFFFFEVLVEKRFN